MSLLRKQLIGAAAAVPAFIVVFVAGRYASTLFGFAPLPADNVAARLAFAAHWLVVPGLTLLAAIGWINLSVVRVRVACMAEALNS